MKASDALQQQARPAMGMTVLPVDLCAAAHKLVRIEGQQGAYRGSTAHEQVLIQCQGPHSAGLQAAGRNLHSRIEVPQLYCPIH